MNFIYWYLDQLWSNILSLIIFIHQSFVKIWAAHMNRDVRKPDFCICENKDADQLRGNPEADHAFIFTSWTVQSLYFLNLKFQTSRHSLWLYSPISVRPRRKPQIPVFLRRGSYEIMPFSLFSGHHVIKT